MIKEFAGKKPKIGKDCFIAETAVLIGDVELADGCNIWYGAVLRGDLAPIKLGKNCNIQDNCTLHVDTDIPLILGDGVSVGHGAIIHSAIVEDNCLIGMGAVLLDKCYIGTGSMVGAGSLVTQGKEIPPFSLVMGVPGKPVKELPPESIKDRIAHADNYAKLALSYEKSIKK